MPGIVGMGSVFERGASGARECTENESDRGLSPLSIDAPPYACAGVGGELSELALLPGCVRATGE